MPAVFHLEEGRSDKPDQPAHLEAAEPANRDPRPHSFPPEKKQKIHEIYRRRGDRAMSLALAPLDVSVELGANLPCRKFDPDLWFSDSPAELELAKSLCGECPLRVECLAGAVERAEPWGVWGGEIFERGAVVPRKRPRGRPRKEDVARDAVLRVEVEARTAAVVEARSAVRLAA
jgi:WhiB family transcriptional regulator, redox-sensing transcriptional regulator